MLREVEAFFADPPDPLDAFETTDADHGRIETRRHRVTHSTDWLFSDRRYAGEPRLPGLATLACVEATRTRPAGPARHPLLRRLRDPHPRAFARAVRGHWAIENACTGCSTSPSTRTAPATAATTAPRTSPSPPPHPQPPQQGPAEDVPRPQTQASRMVRRLRKNHHRPNAIALVPGGEGLAPAPGSVALPRSPERWPSGRRRTPGKCVGGKPSRGFESLSPPPPPRSRRETEPAEPARGRSLQLNLRDFLSISG